MFPVPAVWAFPCAANRRMAMKKTHAIHPLTLASSLKRLFRIEASK
jgi:hypothetical protein